jgi:hypothetical protein
MATCIKRQPLNPKALGVWAIAPLAVAGAVWLAVQAGLWFWAVGCVDGDRHPCPVALAAPSDELDGDLITAVDLT